MNKLEVTKTEGSRTDSTIADSLKIRITQLESELKETQSRLMKVLPNLQKGCESRIVALEKRMKQQENGLANVSKQIDKRLRKQEEGMVKILKKAGILR